ncbi:MAG TPA: ABC transporter ATP-binding protein [Phycisphaeraceae bacterium]
MVPITIRGLTRRFGDVVAVNRVDLDIAAGELFFLLGPSGCGKTTLLRMVAGFTSPNEGAIALGGQDVTHLPPQKRHTGMVFQGYALWPHMTVWQNVAFGLDVRKVAASEKAARVERALKRVQMLPYAQRRPNELSGGQQQRVALARALVIEPHVLLLDEPLSNLDAQLRAQMRSQIRQICKDAGITALYVTHDQKEALAMADRIAVMREGSVVQVGPPRQLYSRPASRFVAGFLGETNFVSAEVMGRQDGCAVLRTTAGVLHAGVFPDDLPDTGNVTCSIRPEAIRLCRDGDDREAPPSVAGRNHFPATLLEATYLGEIAQHRLRVGGQLELTAFELNPAWVDAPSQSLRITIDPADVVVLGD